jgi:hypothetical protein
VSRVDVGGRAGAVVLSGDLGWVAAAGAGLVAVDVSTSASPTTVGRAETPGEALDVAIEGSTAYVAAAQGGLAVVDLGRLGPS